MRAGSKVDTEAVWMVGLKVEQWAERAADAKAA